MTPASSGRRKARTSRGDGVLAATLGASLALVLGVAGAAAQPAPSQPASVTSELKILDQGWRVICRNPDQTRTTLLCSVVFEAADETGQRLVTLEIYRDGDSRKMVMTVPLGAQLAKPVEVSIDQSKPLTAYYESCRPGGCITRVTFDAASLASLRKAKSMTVSFDIGDRKVSLPVSLAGLTLALAKADI